MCLSPARPLACHIFKYCRVVLIFNTNSLRPSIFETSLAFSRYVFLGILPAHFITTHNVFPGELPLRCEFYRVLALAMLVPTALGCLKRKQKRDLVLCTHCTESISRNNNEKFFTMFLTTDQSMVWNRR